MAHYQVLARKYRPQTFKDVLGQEPIVQTLKNALERSTLAHAYLFCGSRGTGKTTLARILAKAINCSALSTDLEPCNACASCQEISSGASLDVLEIDGASHRGIDDVKTTLESVSYCPAHAKCKIYIIDEVHMLTKEAFNALLKTLEEPPANVKFFFATTEVHKIPATILSRCQRFSLQRIPASLIVQKLRRIAEELAIDVDDAALFRVARFAEGGLRDAESLFDQLISYSEGTLTVTTVNEVLGIMPQELFSQLDQAVLTADLAFAFRLADILFSQGKELSHFLEDLTEHFKGILYTKLACIDLLSDFDAAYKEALAAASRIYTQEQCLYILDTIMQTQATIKQAISPQIALEHLLTKIVRAKLRVPVEYLVRRLSELEQTLLPASAPPPHQEEEAAAKPPPPKEAVVQADAPSKAKKQPQTPLPEQKVEPKAVEQAVLQVSPEEELMRKAQHDTLMQFAAVELEGTVRKDIRRK